MNILIVHAHPEPASFCSAMKAAAVAEFEGLGDSVTVSDLYAMQFNPVASAADFTTRANPNYFVYALEQRHAFQAGALASDIQAELEKVLSCDLLILNFPLFWFSTPAILKGWIDRVFVSGLAYGGKRFYDRGGFAGKRALACVTLGGQEHMFHPDSVHGPLTDMLRHFLQGSLAYVGLEVYQPFFAWHVPYISNEARGRILDEWRCRIRTLDGESPLRMPRLDEFDDRLYPLKKSKLANSGGTEVEPQASFS